MRDHWQRVHDYLNSISLKYQNLRQNAQHRVRPDWRLILGEVFISSITFLLFFGDSNDSGTTSLTVTEVSMRVIRTTELSVFLCLWETSLRLELGCNLQCGYTYSNAIFINLNQCQNIHYAASGYFQTIFPRSKELSCIFCEYSQRNAPHADPHHILIFILLLDNEAMQIVFHAYGLEHSISFQLCTQLLLRNSQFVLC